MSFQEFGNLLKYIAANNSPLASPYPKPCVKYIDPVFDMRTNSVFAVTFRGYGDEKVFHTQNECRDLEESLDQRIRAYLDAPLHSA